MIATLRRGLARLIEHLPEPVSARWRPRRFRYNPADSPPRLAARTTPVRLVIGHANYAEQAWHLARAAERLSGVEAIAVHLQGRNARFGFRSDLSVPDAIYQHSAHWRRRFFADVSRHVTHAIIESGRPLFGRLHNFDVVRDVEALRSRGLQVAFHAHGSELRLPSRHRELDEWSPFHVTGDAALDAETARLEAGALRFREQLARAEVPLFVSTPELLLDAPSATWLPLVIDPGRWATDAPVLQRDVLRVVHAPTNPHLKGTALIEPVLESLVEEGLIDYRRWEGVPSSDMPASVAEADVVLEQFRIGTYSAVAVESMAAGRLVIAHVHEQVRAVVRKSTGLELPIVEATPASLDAVLRDVALHRETYARIAASGPEFVATVHDGAMSSRALAPFLEL